MLWTSRMDIFCTWKRKTKLQTQLDLSGPFCQRLMFMLQLRYNTLVLSFLHVQEFYVSEFLQGTKKSVCTNKESIESSWMWLRGHASQQDSVCTMTAQIDPFLFALCNLLAFDLRPEKIRSSLHCVHAVTHMHIIYG